MMETKRTPRWPVLLVLAGLIMGAMGFIAIQDGWFVPRPPLNLDNQPALVFITLSDGCKCQMQVVRAAETQLAAWPIAIDGVIPVLRVDFARCPDLVMQYRVIRAPALVLLDAAGEVVWKQDVGLSDEAPLDIKQAEIQIETLMQNP